MVLKLKNNIEIHMKTSNLQDFYWENVPFWAAYASEEEDRTGGKCEAQTLKNAASLVLILCHDGQMLP